MGLILNLPLQTNHLASEGLLGLLTCEMGRLQKLLGGGKVSDCRVLARAPATDQQRSVAGALAQSAASLVLSGLLPSVLAPFTGLFFS